MKAINVLSLFNGMGCIWLALDRCGIKVGKRYSSEVDKYCNKVNDYNYPDTAQLGDVQKVSGKDLGYIDLLVGGSPCQGFSFAGKQLNFSDPRSALFFEFVRIYNELKVINPNIKFLLENVRMKYDHELVISKLMNVNPLIFNSSLVSAQNRVRLYWTNINANPVGLFGELKPMIPEPKDKGIILKDVLQSEVDEKYYMSDKALSRLPNTDSYKSKLNNCEGKSATIFALQDKLQRGVDLISDNIIIAGTINRNEFIERGDKSLCLDGNYNKGCDNHGQRTVIVHNTMPRSSKNGNGGTGHLSRSDGKTYCLDTGNTNAVEIIEKLEITCSCGCVFIGVLSDLCPGCGEIRSGYTNELPREILQLNPSLESGGKQPYQQNRIYSSNGIIPAQCRDKSDLLVMQIGNHSTGKISHEEDKHPCLRAEAGSVTKGIGFLETNSRIRRLTPIECCRLQTVPDSYFFDSEGKQLVSDTQIYKMCGNGWTVDMITHILSYYK